MRAFFILAMMWGNIGGAAAQSAPEPDTALWLARLYVSESGWDSPTDRAALFHALRNRQETLGESSLLSTMRRYSRPLFASDRPRRRWVQALREDGGAPRFWPRTLTWAPFADRWKAILDEARAHLESPPPNPCDADIEHWGGPYVDRARLEAMIASGVWRRSHCGAGDARNWYLSAR